MRQYLEFAEIRTQASINGCLDLSSKTFLYPTTLLPLLLSIRKSGQRQRYAPPQSPAVRSYIDIMNRDGRLETLNSQNSLPVVALPKSKLDCQKVLDRVYELGGDVGGKDAFRLLVGELVDNIYQHSMCDNAMVMAQKYQGSDELHLCIIDDGITIAGSLRRASLALDDYEAVVGALQGVSAKRNGDRGRGLGSSVRMMTEGYGGKMLVVSGGGGIRIGGGPPVGYKLSENFKYEGTLISMAVPLVKTEVEWYAYV